MSDKVSDILSEIKNEKSSISVYCPSIGKDVDLAPLTLSQQKEIIETSSDTTLAVLFFNNVFFKILKKNCKEDFSKLNTIDRVALTLGLRSHLKNEVEFEEDGSVYINDLIERNKDLEYTIESKTVVSDNFTFHVEAPSLNLDNTINVLLLNKYKNISIDTNKLKNVISDLFSYEILKFIKTLQINDKEINLHDNPKEGIKIIESIEGKHFLPVTEYINEIRDEEVKYTECPKSQRKIDIVPDLFIL